MTYDDWKTTDRAGEAAMAEQERDERRQEELDEAEARDRAEPEPVYECERCGCRVPEEVTGGWRCSACRFQPPECTCYEMTGGHQPGCVFNAAKRSGS